MPDQPIQNTHPQQDPYDRFQGPRAHKMGSMESQIRSPTQSTNPHRPVHRAPRPTTEDTVTHGGSSTYVNNINRNYTRTVSSSPGVPPHKPAHNSTPGSVPPAASSQGKIPSLNEHQVPLASPAPLAPAQSAHAPSAPPDTIATTPLQDDTVGSPVEKFMVLLGCPTSPGGLDRDAIKPADQVDDFSSRVTLRTGADKSTRVFSEEDKRLIQEKIDAYKKCRKDWHPKNKSSRPVKPENIPVWQNFAVSGGQGREEIGWKSVLRRYINGDRAILLAELEFWQEVFQHLEMLNTAKLKEVKDQAREIVTFLNGEQANTKGSDPRESLTQTV